MSKKLTYQELEQRVAELEAESFTRQRAEEALRRSEAILNKSQSIAKIGSWELDLAKNQLFWSDEVYRIFGLHPQEFEATYEAFIDTVHPDDRASVDAAYAGSLREGKDTYEIEHRIVRRNDGKISIVHEKCEHVRDISGRIVGSIGMVQDITERKHSEQLLKKSEARLNSIIRVAPVGIGVVTDRVFQTVNDKLCEMTGFSKEDLIGKSARVIYPSDDEFERVGREKYAEIKKHGLGTIEAKFKRKDGIIIDVLLSSTPLISKDLSKGVTFTALDITERKKAERALKESEEKYRLLIENIPSVTWISNENGETTFISPNVEKIYGFSQKEIYEEGEALWFGRVHPDDVDPVRDFFKRVFEEGIKADVEYRIQRKDGKWIWIYDTAIMAYEESGVKYAYGIFSDITERKRVEEALEKSAVIIDTTSDAVITTNVEGDITFWNKGAEKIYDYPKEEVLGKPISILYKGEDLPVLESMIGELLAGKDIPSIEVTCIDKSRNDVHILLSLMTIKGKDGNITELVGITKDITERKQVEESLRQERDKAQKLLDIAGVMFVAIDEKGEVILLN